MYWMILLSASVGAAIFFAGWYAGNYRHKEEESPKTPGRKRKPRPPKCYVIAPPREGDEEPKKTRKKRSAPGVLGSAEFDEKHIRGIDIRI